MAEKPEDLSLPASVVARIIKEALPDGVNVSKEARTAIAKAASVFILYSTACANNFALKGKRKTLNATDVFSALEDMEFDQFTPELKQCLEVYKQEQKGKKEAAADRRKLKQAAQLQAAQTSTTVPDGPSTDTETAKQQETMSLSQQGTSNAVPEHPMVVASDTSQSVGTDDEAMEVEPAGNDTQSSSNLIPTT